MSMTDTPGPRITVTPNGPYHVVGDVPVVVKAQVETELGEPIAWAVGPELGHKARYALRRKSLGRFGCEACASRCGCNWHPQGESNPGLAALPVTTCEVVAIEGVEPSSQQLSVACSATELHCNGGEGRVMRGTHSSIAAARQRGWNHSR